MTNITLLAFGSRGDVQPMLALSLGLQQAGHTVKVATHRSFESWVRGCGLDFALLSTNLMELIRSPAAQEMLREGKTPLGFIRAYQKLVTPTMEAALLDSSHACQGSDAIVANSLAFWGLDIAEALGVPYYFAEFLPLSSTAAFPHPSIPQELGSLGGWFNRFTYALMWELFWYIYRPCINHWRRSTLNLSPIGLWKSHLTRMMEQNTPILAAYSPNIVPPPKDWSTHIHQTGYWFFDLPKEFVPPVNLVDFLADGKPPVYIGFGSYTGGEEPNKLVEIALAALKKTGQRGVLLTGDPALDPLDLPNTVFSIPSIPHSWLFPKMAAVLHHCGAGTTAAVIRAGIPHIPLPLMGDQPFWGNLVAQLGIGTQPLKSKNLTAEIVAHAIAQAVSNEGMKYRAARLGDKVRTETGVANAVRIVKQTWV